MKKGLRITAAAAAACLLLVGCGKQTKTSFTGDIVYPEDGSIYPMKASEGELTLSVFSYFDTETPRMDYWREATGVNIEFSSAATGSEEAFALMLASNDLPDIILAELFSQPGGIQKYADDGVVRDISSEIDKYAPNFKKWLDKDEEVRKMSLSDDGKYYFFPCIRYENKLRSFRGLQIRKDLLDKYGLSEPETIDEWYNVIKTFKNNGIQAPLSYQLETYEPLGGFISAWGILPTFYLDEGKVKYGYLEDNMKEALKTLAQWYKEGLLDENIVNAGTSLDANVMNSKTAATYTTSGGGMGKYLKATKGGNESFDLVGLKLPVLKKGDKPQFSASTFPVTYDNNGFVTTQCENVELAVRFLDFGYSDEGHTLMNFGKEGVSYEMKNGVPTYTDLIMNNPDGKTVGDAMTDHIFGNWSGPFAQDEGYIEQYNQYPRQKQALNLWGEMMTTEKTMPQVSFTSDESTRISTIMNNITTCANENLFKFIMGIKSIDNDYDSFIQELKGFGIDEAIEIYSAALERYNKR